MGVDLTIGDKVYVHGKGRVMTVEAIILPGNEQLTSISWASVNEFVVLKLVDNLTVKGSDVSIW